MAGSTRRVPQLGDERGLTAHNYHLAGNHPCQPNMSYCPEYSGSAIAVNIRELAKTPLPRLGRGNQTPNRLKSCRSFAGTPAE